MDDMLSTQDMIDMSEVAAGPDPQMSILMMD